MSYKKTMRSIEAASKQAARESARRERERVKLQKQQEKHLAYVNAADEVDEYNAHVEFLVSFHKDCSKPFDWEQISKGPEPADPKQNPHLKPRRDGFVKNRAIAQRSLDEYEPSFSDKLTRRVESKRRSLIEAVENAERQDEREYNASFKQYQDRLETYSKDKKIYELSKRIAARDPEVYLEIGESYFQSEGFSMEFVAADANKVETYLYVDDESMIPSEQKTLLKSGELSVKKLPVMTFWRLYQDYVCSITLRVARENFARLPIDISLVTVHAPMLNTQTGHKEELPILSVAFSRKTFRGLNFQALDPSDAMINFVHRMKFVTRSGFKPIDPLSLAEFNTLD